MKRTIIFLSHVFIPYFLIAQNVGIGTTNPDRPLHIVSDNEALRIQGASPWIGFMNYSDPTYAGFVYYTGTSLVMGSRSGTNLPLTLAPNNNGLLFATAAQRIGIGIGNPSEKLDVNGNVNVAGTIKASGVDGTSGQLLMNNGNGTMQWENISALTSSPSSGFGVWGDCSTSSIIGAYQPVADSASPGVAEYYGSSVSISGDFAIVGSDGDFNHGAYCGAAFIYRIESDKWVQMQKIIEPPTSTNDFFGTSVSISGNYAVIGIPQYINGGIEVGAITIYQYDGANWVFMQRIVNTGGTAGERFGRSVAVSGNRIIVGAPYDDNSFTNQGSISIYQYNGASWVLMQKIYDASGAANDNFGFSVSISGDIAIAGAPNDDNGAFADQGSASVYRYMAGSWVFSIRNTNPSARASVFWGTSVGVSGNSIIIGAPGDIVGANTNQGSISFFDFNGVNWIYGGKYNNPSGLQNDRLGNHVSISGDYAFAGAENAQIGANINQGSSLIFFRFGVNLWQRLITITDPVGAADNLFGTCTALDATTKRFAATAPGFSSNRGKALFGKIN